MNCGRLHLEIVGRAIKLETRKVCWRVVIQRSMIAFSLSSKRILFVRYARLTSQCDSFLAYTTGMKKKKGTIREAVRDGRPEKTSLETAFLS